MWRLSDTDVLLAQDPSFSRLSFSLYDGNEVIYLDGCKFSFEGKGVGFEQVYQASRVIAREYFSKLCCDYGVNEKIFIKKIFSEIPPPTGIYSAGLYALDTFILDRLFTLNKGCDEIYTIPPSFLMTVHNTRKYKKSDSTAIAMYLMEEVLKGKLEFRYKGRMNADMAESFIFLMRAFVKYDVRGLGEEISGAIPGLYSKTEKLLIRRGDK